MNRDIPWKIHRTWPGLFSFIIIGFMAGMFGLGAGWANVPVLKMKNNQQGASEEMILYARVLERGMYAGLILMFVTFFIYLFGIIDPLIPLEHIDSFWNQPVQDYLIQINNEFLGWDEPPLGWSWIKLLGFGDFLNFLPVALLSGITILCYLAIVPGMFQRKDHWMAGIAFAEALILLLAASGLLAVGH